MVKNGLNELAAGYSVALISGLGMLLLGILGNLGVYMGAVTQMMQWHTLFSLSFLGIVGGIIEASVVGFLITYLLVYFYNKFL